MTDDLIGQLADALERVYVVLTDERTTLSAELRHELYTSLAFGMAKAALERARGAGLI